MTTGVSAVTFTNMELASEAPADAAVRGSATERWRSPRCKFRLGIGAREAVRKGSFKGRARSRTSRIATPFRALRRWASEARRARRGRRSAWLRIEFARRRARFARRRGRFARRRARFARVRAQIETLRDQRGSPRESNVVRREGSILRSAQKNRYMKLRLAGKRPSGHERGMSDERF